MHPVKFAGRVLKGAEIRYDIVEKEVLALLRILDVGYNMLSGKRIKVLSRHSTLRWLFETKTLPEGRLRQWAALLSPYELEVTRLEKDEDVFLGLMAASITPREKG